MQIFENFIKPRVQNELETLFAGNNFPYYYEKESTVPAKEDGGLTGGLLIDENVMEAPQFFHMFVSDGGVTSNAYKDISPVINKLLDTVDTDCFVYRCKVNMNLADVRFEGKYHTPHIDNGFDEQVTAIYYVNDSDGDTFFFDDSGKITKRVTPKKGTLVMWNGKVFHAKSSPIKTTSRIVLNINLLPHRN